MNLLHSQVHHHIGHRGNVWSTVSRKGLYEFAMAFDGLDQDARTWLWNRVCGDVRLAAGLDIWIAAAHDLFAMPVARPFEVHADALEVWSRIKANGNVGTEGLKYPGYLVEIRLASSPERLRKAGSSSYWLARRIAQGRVLASLFAPKLPSKD